MRINTQNYISFQRRLTDSEIAEYSAVLKEAKEKVGNKGHSLLIMPSSSLPNSLNNNMGCGNMLTKESGEFFDFAKLYWGINYVQLLPEGQYSQIGNVVNPYSGSSLDLGLQLINPELLDTDEYAHILSKEDIQKIINSNTKPNKDICINFENTISKDSPTEKALRKAFDELIKEDNEEKRKLLKEFEKYSTENKDWLEGKSLYRALALKNKSFDFNEWTDEIERNLFNPEKVSIEQREKVIKEISSHSEYGKEKAFYMFTQFLSDKHLAKARDELNAKGIKISGDMIVGCSKDEFWAFPTAFYKEYELPWSFKAINYDTEDGLNFLKLKARSCAKRYDGVRVDASWLYAKQQLYSKENGKYIEHYRQYDDKILNIIEEEIKKVRGKDFDLHNVMHEFEANPWFYPLYDDIHLKKEVRERLKVFKSDFMSKDWETVSAFRRKDIEEGTYMLGTTNHDTLSLKQLFQHKEAQKPQADILSKILKIPREQLDSLSGFMQAKFAEPIRAFHNMFFFSDALNLDGSYNVGCTDRSMEFRLKIPANYQDKYFESLSKGEGLNIMDALDKAFVAEGLDKKEPELYNKIVKFKEILQIKENSSTPSKKGGKGGIVAAIVVAVVAATVFLVKHAQNSKKKEQEKTINA